MIREAWIVFDLGFGDAGKGTVTDFLVRNRGSDLVVRFNGGAQAGHNVTTADGRHHTFSQFGSGSFVESVGTHLGRSFVLHPGGLRVEADALARAGVADALRRTTIDASVLVASPFHQAAGRLRELLRGDAVHGTCGVGIGEAVANALAEPGCTLRAADLARPAILERVLTHQQQHARRALAAAAELEHPLAATEWRLLCDGDAPRRVASWWAELALEHRVIDDDGSRRRLQSAGCVVFEGAHGVLLDQDWGFHPHTTWSDCSPAEALAMLDGTGGAVTRLGVTRAYATRHGAGPFPTDGLGLRERLPEAHNGDCGWQGPYRTGALDLVLLRYALEVCGGVDGLAITCLDRVSSPLPVCLAYEIDDPPARLVERGSGNRVRRLRPGSRHDLDHRQRLGELLREVRPLLTEVSPGELPPLLEHELGVPVLLTSRGPTAADKSWRSQERLNVPTM
ncbi:MAG: adenylosuccinate synthetase [Thermoanaerobaculales bacterium]|nr:adenylosuccinate synthetase [Thermoanaerobaculales bacterium]